jgi:hypothetical protein
MTKPSPARRGLAASISLRGSIAGQMCGSPTICKDHTAKKVGGSDPGSSTGKPCPTMEFEISEDVGSLPRKWEGPYQEDRD